MSLYEDKSISYFSDVRDEVIQLMPVAEVERLFEVGCGTGATLSYIKSCHRAKWVGGIELVAQAADLSSSDVDLLITGDIEVTGLPLEENSIDVMLCLDVLEHLKDPWQTVVYLRKFIKPGGILIASLPNIKNIKVLLPLILQDRWDYVSCGILDRSHLRFFTKSTGEALFKGAGFDVDIIPKYFNNRGKAGLINTLTFSLFRTFLQYQYLYRAIKV